MSEETTLPQSEAEWRERLDPMQYRVLSGGRHRTPVHRDLLEHQGLGNLHLCGVRNGVVRLRPPSSNSGTGWPSFYRAMDRDRIETRVDHSYGMVRTEVLCKACGGHLGHVFPDGPGPDGMRYCINSCSLELRPSD